jgi:DNA mismatch repair protein MutL
MLMVGRYPLAALFLELPPEQVDVNVHPAKAEVRFRDPERIFSFVQRSTRRALLAYAPVPPVGQPAGWGNVPSLPRQVDAAWALAHEQTADRGPSTVDAGLQEHAELEPASYGPPSAVHGPVPLLRLIGQVGATYLVAEGPDGLYLIDQHAAHERVLFEKLMARRGRRGKNGEAQDVRASEVEGLTGQVLLTPVVVEVSSAAAGLLSGQLPALRQLGFEVEAFGEHAFQVRAVPDLFSRLDPAAALRALVEDFEEDESPLANEIEARIAGRVCKRLAVRAGQVLSGEEQRALLTDLEACAAPRTCPHGRPTMIHLSVDLLERQFGRRGAR